MGYPKRKQNKVLSQRSMLKYQEMLRSKSKYRPDLSPERKALLLAAAAAKLNLWSSLVAVETARLDALRAYGEDYLVPTTVSPPVDDIASPFSFYARRKRRKDRTND